MTIELFSNIDEDCNDQILTVGDLKKLIAALPDSMVVVVNQDYQRRSPLVSIEHLFPVFRHLIPPSQWAGRRDVVWKQSEYRRDTKLHEPGVEIALGADQEVLVLE